MLMRIPYRLWASCGRYSFLLEAALLGWLRRRRRWLCRMSKQSTGDPMSARTIIFLPLLFSSPDSSCLLITVKHAGCGRLIFLFFMSLFSLNFTNFLWFLCCFVCLWRASNRFCKLSTIRAGGRVHLRWGRCWFLNRWFAHVGCHT